MGTAADSAPEVQPKGLNYVRAKLRALPICRFSLVISIDAPQAFCADVRVMKGKEHEFAFGTLPAGGRFFIPASKLAALFLASVAITHAGPAWEKPSLFLGSLDVDGGLRQRFELGVLSGSPEFSLPVYLEHGFRAED
ncbi:MAG: hypothetical protein RLZZ522_2217, partial [Verrucomicrobiota bacterium]